MYIMYINISKSETGNNKGSCAQLVAYLEKENRLDDNYSKNFQPEYWFNQGGNSIQPYEVRTCIDSNISKLSKDEAKFFLINISPSEKELLHLKTQFGEDEAKNYLKQYANQVMDLYARNFKRAGIEGNGNLVYFGKLENNRYYSFKDPEVKERIVKKGDAKPGEQMHIQIIVSRKDASNKIKLSPLNNSKGTNAEHSRKVGQFERVAFKQTAEKLFDHMFDYKRGDKESFYYANTLKNGSYEQKFAMNEAHTEFIQLKNDHYSNQKNDLLEILDKVNRGDHSTTNSEEFFVKKKKRRWPDQNQDRGL